MFNKTWYPGCVTGRLLSAPHNWCKSCLYRLVLCEARLEHSKRRNLLINYSIWNLQDKDQSSILQRYRIIVMNGLAYMYIRQQRNGLMLSALIRGRKFTVVGRTYARRRDLRFVIFIFWCNRPLWHIPGRTLDAGDIYQDCGNAAVNTMNIKMAAAAYVDMVVYWEICYVCRCWVIYACRCCMRANIRVLLCFFKIRKGKAWIERWHTTTDRCSVYKRNINRQDYQRLRLLTNGVQTYKSSNEKQMRLDDGNIANSQWGHSHLLNYLASILSHCLYYFGNPFTQTPVWDRGWVGVGVLAYLGDKHSHQGESYRLYKEFGHAAVNTTNVKTGPLRGCIAVYWVASNTGVSSRGLLGVFQIKEVKLELNINLYLRKNEEISSLLLLL